MRLVNLCPHPITFISLDGVKHRLSTCKVPPRACDQQYTRILHTNYGNISIRGHRYTVVRDMPEPKSGVLYIVGKRIRDLFPNRDDLISPSAERIDPEHIILSFEETFTPAQYDDMVAACSQPVSA